MIIIYFVDTKHSNVHVVNFINEQVLLQNWNLGSEFSSYEIQLRNRVTQNGTTLRVTNPEIFLEIPLSSY